MLPDCHSCDEDNLQRDDDAELKARGKEWMKRRLGKDDKKPDDADDSNTP